VEAEALDVAPGNFDSHVVVASSILTMGKTHSSPRTRPKRLTPIHNRVAMVFAEVVNQHSLSTHCEALYPDVTFIDYGIVILVVRILVRKVLDMRVLRRVDTCRRQYQKHT
jgi:hypothetical protein